MEDAETLDRRAARNDGWAGPRIAALLVEYGHLDVVERLAGQGDWTCAQAWAKHLVAAGQPDAALGALTAFADVGWWPAQRAVARCLEELGRIDDAIRYVRVLAQTGHRFVVADVAEVLARNGCGGEAFALVRPMVSDPLLARTLVGISEGLGRDGEVFDALRGVADADGVVCPIGPGPHRWQAADLVATVLERQGKVDEAVALLQEHVCVHRVINVNVVLHLTDILAARGRYDDVRTLIDGHGDVEAAMRFAAFLESRSDVDGAFAVLEPFTETDNPNAGVCLSDVLLRAGRTEEALQALHQTMLKCPDDWVMHRWGELMVDCGRVDEALDYFARGTDLRDLDYELLHQRIMVLDRSGRRQQAIDELRAHPDVGEPFAAWQFAALLSTEGCLDEAITVLEPDVYAGGTMNADQLAGMLIRRGRVEEAVEIFQRPKRPVSWGTPGDSGRWATG